MRLLDGSRNNRILVVDDNEAIHDDYEKILGPTEAPSAAGVDAMAESLFGEVSRGGPIFTVELDHALQGQEALELVGSRLERGEPYAMVFMDVRMPPGWNGVETVERIWQIDHEIEVVLCTAYSDFSWEEIAKRLKHAERLLILRKPFDPLEVRQLAHGLTTKWLLRRQAACRMQDLEIMVEERVRELEAMRVELEGSTTRSRKAGPGE